ncbi:hypothetical protein ACJMK2_011308 [Sinanodonta woodiana]|uniref:G-protein coupled receptors family 3 profile domain-containing protein n=1 Tax=Sinanodonta woodiana TaxID=1069815 RepID=A0ABD3V7N2_SINWO
MLQPSEGSNPATIVALLNTHASAGGIYTYRCGAIYHETGFLNALAFFYTLQKKVDRAFNVRGLVINQCGNPLRADQDAYNLLSKGKLCNSDFNTRGDIINNSTIVGFITPGSRNTDAANRVLAPLKMPLVSFTSTSSVFNDIEKYPYLARVVPPDENQMRVIAQILKQMGWNYISVVYTTEPVGRAGIESLRKSIEDLGSSTCIGLAIAISETASIEKGKDVVRQLLAQDGADVVVLVSVKPQTITMAANALGVADKFRFIGLDIWGSLMFPVQGFEDKMLGSITVEFRNAEIEDFGKWLETLNYNERSFIPNDWFDEFYQAWFQCYLPNALVVRSEFTVPCRTDLKFNRKSIPPRALLYMIAATYALGEGLYNFRTSYCRTAWTFTECLQNVANSRDVLFNSILAVKWEMEKNLELIPNEEYHLNFTTKRYWDSGYKVNVLTKDTTTGTYFYKELGREIRGALNLSTYQGFRKVVSACPAGRDCNCVVVVGGQTQAQKGQQYGTKEEPRNYFFYDENSGKAIYTWPIWAIVVAILTCLGLLIGILLFFYFLFAYPIHGGTTPLGFLLIFGILCIYAINFAFFYPASEETCGARRFCMGVVYAIAFAALFIKAVDNFRFSETEYSIRQYKGLTSSFSLFVMALGIILIEVIIPVEWLILENPAATKMSENTRHDWMWCTPNDFYDISLVLSMIFVMVLILLTAIFAALSWDSDSNYYESRWILLSCICTAGCFLVWMIVSTSAKAPYRDPAVAIANLVNATALLICMPIRKLVLLCYVKNYEEEEKMQSTIEPGHDLYSTVYPNQAYEPDVFQNVESKYESERSY